MTRFSGSSRDPANVRQSVIEAVRRLETHKGDGSAPTPVANGNDGFRLLIQGLAVPVLVIQGGKIRYGNAQASRLTGIESADGFVGRYAGDLVPPEQREALSTFLYLGEGAEGPATQRFTLVRADKNPLDVDITVTAFYWGDGNAIAATLAVAEIRDVPPVDSLVSVATEIQLPESWSPPNPDWITNAEMDWPDLDAENWPFGPLLDPVKKDPFVAAVADDVAPPPIIDVVGVEIIDEPVPEAPLSAADGLDPDTAPAFDNITAALSGLSLETPPLNPAFSAIIDTIPLPRPWQPSDAIQGLNDRVARPAGAPPDLEKAQRLSETALTAATNGIAILDAAAQGFPVVYVNAAFEGMFGYSFDEAVGQRDDLLFGEPGDQSAARDLRQAMAGLRDASARIEVPVKDGQPVWCDIRLSVARDPDGEATHFIVVYDDVSDRHSEQKRAHQATERLSAFTQTAAEWFWEFDADLRYAYASDRYFEITGDRPTDILGKTIYEFQQGVETTNLDKLFSTLEAAEPFSGHVFSRSRADGTVVWFSSDGRPIVDADGEFTGYRGAARDITAELAARRALRENVQRHRDLTARLPAMTYQRERAADGTFKITFMSDVAREIYGLEPGEIAATPELLVGHIHAADREIFEQAFSKSAETMEPFSVEGRLHDVRGQEKWILTSGRPSAGEGRAVVWDCLAIDVTEHKRPAVQIQKARDLYRGLIKNDTRLICCLDRHGTCTFANAPFATKFGIAPSEVLNRRIADMLPADLARQIHEGARRTIDGRTQEAAIIDVAGANGETAAFRVAWAPLQSESGTADQVQVTWTDVVELRALESTRRETERHLGLIMNAGTQRIAYVDSDQRYRFNNRLHQQSLADPAISAAGRSMRDVLGDAAYRRTQPHIETALSGEIATYEWSVESADGPRHHLTTLTPHKSDVGKVVGFLAVSDDLSDRRRLERDLDERELRFQNLAANLPGVVYQRMVDWQGRLSFTFVSEGMRDVLGIEPSALLADPDLAHRMVHPEDLPAVKEAMEASRIDPVPYDIEIRCLKPDGETVWLRSIAHPYMRPDDNAVVWDGLLIDISELRKSETARLEIDQRYGRLVELSAEGLVIHDGERILFANGQAALMHKARTPDDLIGRQWADLIHSDGNGANNEAAMRRGADGGSAPSEQRRLTLDGGEFIATTRVATVEWQGQPATLVTIRDISDQRATDAALRDSEKRLRLLIDRSADAIYVISGEKIAYANDVCARLLGVPDCDHLFGAQAKEFSAIASDLCRDGEAAKAGVWRSRAETSTEGSDIHFEEMVFPIDWKDQPSHLVICRDMTERVRTEEALAAARAEVAKLAAGVEMANEEIDRANETKTRFLAGLNREIRTPLNGIIGMSGLLIDSVLGEDQRQHAETIRQSGKSLLGTLNDLIEFARLHDDDYTVVDAAFETRPTIEAALELLSSHAYGKGIDLAAYIAPNVPEWLVGNSGQLRQILVNLVSNAIRFTDRGAVTVKVNLADEATAGKVSLYIRVADTGCGVARDKGSHLFESFNRVEADDVANGGHMGLGLAVCRELVGLMGGEIGVESEPGVGSTFWFKIGLGLADAAPEPRIKPLLETLAGRQVLLVGGNAVTRRLLHKQLRAFGMGIAQANGADQALAVLADAVECRSPFDLAVIDLSLPDMDPSELAQRIREQLCHRGLKLLLVAPTGRNIGRDQARQLGFDAGLKKPLRQDSLINRLAALFGATVDDRWHSAAPEQRPAAGVRLHILLAEDNPADRDILAHSLIRAGHRVDVANNGIEAVNAVRNIPYDLVLMDARMPELDGVTATRMIRSFTGTHAQTPIICLADTGDENTENRKEAGVTEVLTKPVDPDGLAEALARLCLDDRAATAIPETPQQVPEITPQERRELKDLLASLDDIMDRRR